MTRAPKKERRNPEQTVVEFYGRALRERRLAAGLTQANIAHSAGMSQTKIPAIEAGKTSGLRLITAEKLAKAVGASLRDLLPPN
jgi:transcriptional regulator with XRE-family HTH domain